MEDSVSGSSGREPADSKEIVILQSLRGFLAAAGEPDRLGGSSFSSGSLGQGQGQTRAIKAVAEVNVPPTFSPLLAKTQQKNLLSIRVHNIRLQTKIVCKTARP